MLPPIRLTPFVLRIVMWAVGAGLFIALAFGAWQSFRLAEVRTLLAQAQRDRAADAAEAERAAREQERAHRAQEDRWTLALRKASHDAEHQIEAARADAVRADAAGRRLQQRVDALAAAARRAAAHPAAADAGPPADDPAGVLADLQRRADEAAGLMARVADERGAAGLACERAFDALTEPAAAAAPD